MQKKKIFKIEDSNIEGIGTDADKACRASAAATEKAWKRIKLKVGLTCWRIEKFKVKLNVQGAQGIFYNDDSYILLNIYKVEDKFKSDIHFWLGETTSQDEAGTAAYKTVELDDYINATHKIDPVQHRECSGHEGKMFLKLFQKTNIRLLEGGIESGFNHVEPEKFFPRLLHIKGKRNIRVTEVDIKISSLNSGDVFVLDAGLKLYQYQGTAAGKHEKLEAGKLQRAIDDERRGKPEVFVFGQADKPDDTIGEFYSFFEDAADAVKAQGIKAGGVLAAKECAALIAGITEDKGVDDATWEKNSTKALFQLSDDSGELTFKEVGRGKVSKDLLKSDDVFIFDIGCEVYVWVGKKASKQEKSQGMTFASKYLIKYERPAFLPVTQIFEGGENEVFEGAFA